MKLSQREEQKVGVQLHNLHIQFLCPCLVVVGDHAKFFKECFLMQQASHDHSIDTERHLASCTPG